ASKLSRTRPKVILTRHMAKSPSSWFSRKWLLANCDGIIAVSNFVKEVLVNGHHDTSSLEEERHHRFPLEGDHRKITVIYGGIDTHKFVPGKAPGLRESWGIKTDEFVFAVVGGYGLPRGKGQREFLKSASLIHSKNSKARFLIIGRGNMQKTLEEDIERLGLKGKAWLTPYCHDMPSAMNAIDCLVHPQIGTEAFGLVLLEAFACGKPVIATELDGIPEAFDVAKYGKLIQPESVEALASAMTELIINPSDVRNASELHCLVDSQFSLESATNRVLNYYRRLAGISK
ncbi:MAG: glycosyltransferase involved in cell wall biosynthesis, partial [Verrucomicrobiales bacterium]|nr:glycosyltransferase involved in cell wall biosynthesis [Verrucomicrobiales bacterium]